MITQFTCINCKNNDRNKAAFYDGALGYEAIYCTVCGCSVDHYGWHLPDYNSAMFIKHMRKIDDMSTVDLQIEAASYDEIIAYQKRMDEQSNGRERTDNSDTYYLPRLFKGRFREVNDEIARRITREQGDPHQRVLIKRLLRKHKIAFNTDASMETLLELKAQIK